MYRKLSKPFITAHGRQYDLLAATLLLVFIKTVYNMQQQLWYVHNEMGKCQSVI